MSFWQEESLLVQLEFLHKRGPAQGLALVQEQVQEQEQGQGLALVQG